MRLTFVTIVLFFSLTKITVAQQREIPRNNNVLKNKFVLKDRLVFGGGLTLNFGSVIAIGAAPTVGLKITDKWMAGVGVNYLYYNDKFYNYSTNIYGGNVFTRYKVLENLFAHVEYAITNWEVPVQISNNTYTVERRNIPAFYVGGGYSQPLGRNSNFVVIALYDLLYDPLTSYAGRPFEFRAGVNVGF
jgi:hypothetical protein